MNKTTGRGRRAKNTVTTRSGNSLRINRSLGDRAKAKKAARSAEKAAYLSTLPKNRWLRTLYRLHPKRVFHYWFSRQGGIMALKIIGISIVVGFFMTIGLFAYFRKDLPQIKDLSGDSLGGTTVYYDRTGQTILYNDYDNIKRIPVESKAISTYAKQATVAIEDKDFYKHGAYDTRGILRAGYHDITGKGGSVQGGSTITQQLVKLNQNWTDNRTVTRKVKELILAVELEREYTKDDILTGYLNVAPYGGSEYGIESAARDYFQVSAKDLTLAQAAMLAAMPQAPGIYSPYSSSKYNSAVTSDVFNQDALIGRQHYILDQMVKQGFVTKQAAAAAKQVDVMAQVHPQADKYANIKAPYFVLAAKQQLEQTYGATTVNRGGWKVITSVDLNLQAKAEQTIAANIPNVTRRTAGLADDQAMVVEDVHTGQIVALVGGNDFNNPDYGNLNFAASSKISPGSTFKPYDYATLIDNNNNVGAGSVLNDSVGPLPGYPCTNKAHVGGNCLNDYDFLNPGPIPIRYALGGSRNIPAVKAMYEAVPNDKSKGNVDSVNKVINTASAMMYNPYLESKHQKTYNCYSGDVDVNTAGPEDVSQCYGASAIGDGAYLRLDDHANGLSTLARLGTAIPKTYILKITNAANKTVALPEHKPRQAVKADTAYIVDNMAADPRASYLPGSCSDTNCSGYKFHRYNGWQFAIKTGTTNDSYDGLMASWSNKYAVVSWVGNHTRNVDITTKVPSTTMELLTEPLTKTMMEAAHDGLKPDNWVQPATVKSAPAFVLRSKVSRNGEQIPSPTNDLFPGWYIGGGGSKTSSQTLDKVSGKLATSCTPAAAKYTAGNSNVTSWNIDIFSGGKPSIGTTATTGSSSAATDDVHNCNDSPPTVTLTAPGSCPATGCTVTATVTQGTHPLSDSQHPSYPGSISFTLGGQTIHSERISASPSTISFNYTPTGNGNGPLTATVTDSVLYSGSASSNLSYSAASPISLSLTGLTTTSAAIQWSGGSGSFTAFLNDAANPSCQSINANSCTVVGAIPAGSRIYVEDNSPSSNKSNTITTP